ncbi:hypothetical protein [Amycolatopsis sp. NPDC098790]
MTLASGCCDGAGLSAARTSGCCWTRSALGRGPSDSSAVARGSTV